MSLLSISPMVRLLVLLCLLVAIGTACSESVTRPGDAVPSGAADQPPNRVAESTATEAEPPEPPMVSRVRSLIREKRWQEVITAADDAIAAGLQSADLYMLKGRAHDALDEYDGAEVALLEAFRLDRASPEPLYLLSESAERRGQRVRCEQLYRRILGEVDPRFAPAREQLVRLYLNEGRIERAMECFSGFERHEQVCPAAARCQAYLNFRTNRGEDRLDAYRAELGRVVAEYPEDARTHIDLAMIHLASGEYEQALAMAEKAIDVAPDSLRALELKATVEAKLLRFGAATEVVGVLLKDRPRSVRYQQNLVDLALDKGDFDAAIRHLRRLLERGNLMAAGGTPALPGERRALFTGRLVEVLVLAGRFDEAVETAKQWLDDAPDDPRRRAGYLSVLSEADRHGEAIDIAAGWLAGDPTNTALRQRLVGQLAGAERYVEAQQHVLGWLADEPENAELHETLIRLCWMAEQWDGAIALAQTGAELTEHQARQENLLCRSYILAERYDEAVAFYQTKIGMLDLLRRRAERAGDSAGERIYYEAVKGSHREMLSTLIVAERFREAEQAANQLLLPEIERRDAGDDYDETLVMELRRRLATIHQLTDRPSQAAQQLEEIYKIQQRDPGINNDLGYTWADAGMYLDRAEQMIRFAVGERPRESAYLDSLGWVLYKRGKIDEAVDFLKLAVRQAKSEDPVMHDHLGDALYRAGLRDEAGTNWEKSLDLSDPDNDSHITAEERRLHQQVQAKLRQLADGEEVHTAPVVGATATQPALEDEPAAAAEPAGSG